MFFKTQPVTRAYWRSRGGDSPGIVELVGVGKEVLCVLNPVFSLEQKEARAMIVSFADRVVELLKDGREFFVGSAFSKKTRERLLSQGGDFRNKGEVLISLMSWKADAAAPPPRWDFFKKFNLRNPKERRLLISLLLFRADAGVWRKEYLVASEGRLKELQEGALMMGEHREEYTFIGPKSDVWALETGLIGDVGDMEGLVKQQFYRDLLVGEELLQLLGERDAFVERCWG